MLIAIRFILTVLWFFGIGLVALPIFLLRPFNLDNSVGYARFVMPGVFKILGIKVEVRNRDKMTRHIPCIFVLNHQHTLDVFVFGSLLTRNTIVIGKREIAWIPIFGWLYWLSGHVLINRKDHAQSIAGMRTVEDQVIKKGHSVFIFPEGTRSWGEGMRPFKKGAFRLALATQTPLLPVIASTIRGHVHLNKLRAGRVIVDILEPISTQGKTIEDLDLLIQETHDRMASGVAKLDAQLFGMSEMATS